MAETYFPFENVDVSEIQFSQWASNFQDSGVKGVPNDTNLVVSANSSGMQVFVAAGEALVRGMYYINGTSKTLTIDAVGTNTRIDAIVVELDTTANTILAKVVKGTAVVSNPVAPTLVQSNTGIYQLLLGYVTIPANASTIAAGDVTDLRTFMGRRMGIWTTATRPANPTANATTGYNVTTGLHEVWNGSSWGSLAPEPPSPFLLMGA